MIGQGLGDGVGEHVAAARGFVAENAVEEEVNRPAVMNADERRTPGRAFGNGGAGFGEEDMGREVRELNAGTNLPILVEEGFAEGAVAKAPAKPRNFPRLPPPPPPSLGK